jgi:hypothetical protein
MKRIQLIITLCALALAVIHILFPSLEIDGTTVTLLAIAVIPWLGPLFKAIELPGGLKVEYQDLLRVEKKAADAGLLAPTGLPSPQSRHIYAFEAVTGDDPNLALAGLRIEIESRLRDIASSMNISVSNKSTRWLTRELRLHRALRDDEISAIEDLLPLLNRAVHGAKVDEGASRWALDIGARILRALEDRQGETTVPQLIERWRRRDGAAVAEVGMELSKAFVKSPIAFLRAMESDPDSFGAWIDDLGHHTFTIFESRNELEDDLYGAYCQKLKALMEQAARQALDSEYRAEAQRIIDALNKIEIRRIW